MELTNEFGHTVWSANYTGFGQAKIVSGSSVRNSIRYQGQYSDDEIGLHYNRFRYYDYLSGQYTSADPIGLEGGDLLNQYVSDPVSWIDPLGLQGVCPPKLTRQQQQKVQNLRNGKDVSAKDVKEARALLDNMPELRPGPSNVSPGMRDPANTYRGDLINVKSPTSSKIHDQGKHADQPHYNLNIRASNGDRLKPAIFIND